MHQTGLESSRPLRDGSAGPSAARSPRLLPAAGLVVGATILAYLTSFDGVLVFDDLPGIAENPTIRDLSRPSLLFSALGPEAGTLAGRPLPNLTLALNYAISGDALWSYHAFNLLVHVVAALALWSIVRRTLRRPSLAPSFGEPALRLATAVALLWSLHPLQTESVTYLVQRVESLMGMFFLATLYCFVRAADSASPRRWLTAAFFSCLAGTACKEVMATAPVIVALYDRVFVAGSWRAVWRRRWRFHAALASTWILLAMLVVASGGRGGTAGFGAGFSAWHYLLTQSRVILGYLQLMFWPHPLIFDHHTRLATGVGDVWVSGVIVAGALVCTGWLLTRRPAAGFLAAAFFIVLAPTSSVVPVADAMVEHRLYLPLAAVLTALVVGLHRGLGRANLRAWALAAVVLGLLTARRNLDYHSALGLWEDTARKTPENPRAHSNIGAYLLELGRDDEARQRLETAVKLDAAYSSAHYNLGKLCEKKGDLAGAESAYATAVRLKSDFAEAHLNLGRILDRLGRPGDAVPHFEAVIALERAPRDAHAGLGVALLRLRRAAPAIQHLRAALALQPADPEGWYNLGRAHQLTGDGPAARTALERAVELRPDFPEALYLLGVMDAAAGDFPAAIRRFRRAVDVSPGYVAARNNLANALLLGGEVEAAIVEYRRILQERPDDRSVQENLARALELRRRP